MTGLFVNLLPHADVRMAEAAAARIEIRRVTETATAADAAAAPSSVERRPSSLPAVDNRHDVGRRLSPKRGGLNRRRRRRLNDRPRGLRSINIDSVRWPYRHFQSRLLNARRVTGPSHSLPRRTAGAVGPGQKPGKTVYAARRRAVPTGSFSLFS
jgi:hypothetical protein